MVADNVRALSIYNKAGFVEYVPGVGRGRATEYRLLEKGEDYLPIKSPPEIHPESPPPNKIKKKIKTFSGGGEGAATSEGERAVEDFATEHCDNLDVYLRMTEDVKTEVCKSCFLIHYAFLNYRWLSQ